METKFNVDDTIVYQDKSGKFVEGIVEEITVAYYVRSKKNNTSLEYVPQEKAYKNKQEVINQFRIK